MLRKPALPEPAGARRERRAGGGFGSEPPLREVLADPIVQAVMRRDGVSLAALGSVIARARQRLRNAPPSGPGLPEMRVEEPAT